MREVPAGVRAVAGQRQVRVAWVNELGGVTFEVGEGAGRCFVKWSPASSPVDLGAERVRLQWARAYVRTR